MSRPSDNTDPKPPKPPTGDVLVLLAVAVVNMVLQILYDRAGADDVISLALIIGVFSLCIMMGIGLVLDYIGACAKYFDDQRQQAGKR